MDFSVIIPVYNKLHLLERNLYCLKHQSLLPRELIISDDGSSEDLKGLLNNMDFPFPVKYVHQEDQGFRLARCRNNGARIASGEYLIFLDQDIVYTLNYLETFIKHANEKKFLSPYPVRLTQKQSEKLTNDMIETGQYGSIINGKQLHKIHRQYFDDKAYQLFYRLKLREFGSKIRGLSLGLFKSDFIQVNGFDEQYIGWGNEDDDLCRRLHRFSIVGHNVFNSEFPIHLWHEPHHNNGERVNFCYNYKRKREIRSGKVLPEYGYHRTFGGDPVNVMDIC